MFRPSIFEVDDSDFVRLRFQTAEHERPGLVGSSFRDSHHVGGLQHLRSLLSSLLGSQREQIDERASYGQTRRRFDAPFERDRPLQRKIERDDCHITPDHVERFIVAR